MASALLDTGALIALVNRADRYHPAAAEWFGKYRGSLLTTEAVLTETAYVLAASRAHQRAALLWAERDALQVCCGSSLSPVTPSSTGSSRSTRDYPATMRTQR